MNLLEVKLENFLSHKKTRVSFPSGLTGVIGTNGSGKSSLIKDSITWALWGESRVSGAGDDLIYDGEDHCSSSVTFTSGGKQYLVTRSRTRDKKTSLTLLRHDELNEPLTDLSRPTLKSTQEEIDKVLGMSYEVFKNSCCIEQGKSSSFSELTPSQASKVLLKILQLDKYDKYNQVVSESLKSTDVNLTHQETLLNHLNEMVISFQNSKQIQSSKQSTLEVLKVILLTTERNLADALLRDDTLTKSNTVVATRLSEVTSEIDSLGTSLLKLQKQSTLLQQANGSCPLCETHLTFEVKELVKQKVQNEIDSLLSKISLLELEKSGLMREVSCLQADRKSLKLDDQRTTLIELKQKISNLEGELSILQSAQVSEDKSMVELNVAKEKWANLKSKQGVYTKLREAFGPKGIPLLVIDNTIRELEVLINENLKVLSDMPSKVELATQYESADGSLIDTFEISIVTNLQKRPYFNYSGGERFIIDLAIRLGLSELLARRNNFKVETLIIDEGLGSLDGTNQVNFFTALTRLIGRFEKILVITHTSVKEYFKNVIEVKNEGGISRLDKHINPCYTSIER